MIIIMPDNQETNQLNPVTQMKLKECNQDKAFFNRTVRFRSMMNIQIIKSLHPRKVAVK